MKLLSFALMVVMSLNLWAVTREEAEQAWSQRDYNEAGIQAAKHAADLYESLAANEADMLEKIELILMQSRALNFAGDASVKSEDKIAIFLKAKDVALAAANLLEKREGEAADESNTELLARCYYWYGSNLGRWGEANGVLGSLGQLPTLKKYMQFIIDLGEEQVEEYGSNRIMGRIYFKLPFPMGSNKTSLELLSKAHDRTLHEDGSKISSYGLNVVYYAETLIAVGGAQNRAKAKDLLTRFVAKGASAATLRAYNENRIPETKKEIADALNLLKNL